jgi:hypothetical protein
MYLVVCNDSTTYVVRKADSISDAITIFKSNQSQFKNIINVKLLKEGEETLYPHHHLDRSKINDIYD